MSPLWKLSCPSRSLRCWCEGTVKWSIFSHLLCCLDYIWLLKQHFGMNYNFKTKAASSSERALALPPRAQTVTAALHWHTAVLDGSGSGRSEEQLELQPASRLAAKTVAHDLDYSTVLFIINPSVNNWLEVFSYGSFQFRFSIIQKMFLMTDYFVIFYILSQTKVALAAEGSSRTGFCLATWIFMRLGAVAHKPQVQMQPAAWLPVWACILSDMCKFCIVQHEAGTRQQSNKSCHLTLHTRRCRDWQQSTSGQRVVRGCRWRDLTT